MKPGRERSFILSALNSLIFSFWLLFAVISSACASPPAVTARSAVVMDASTGVILYEKNADERLPVASLTKVMTAVVAAEEVADWSTSTAASTEACSIGESEIYLEPGERIKLEDLLYAVLLKSANDAAYALGEAAGGNINIFVALMNRKAAELGMKNSHFTNPHGLDAPGHYSSARDMAVLARYALSFPLLKQAFATRKKVIPWPGREYDRLLENHNKLLRYDFVKGIKTGYTLKAGHCLISYAEFGNRKIIAVVLHSADSPSCYSDSLALLEYGRDLLVERKMASRDSVLGVTWLDDSSYRLISLDDIVLTVPSVSACITYTVSAAPAGDSFSGIVSYYCNGRYIGSFPVRLEKKAEPVKKRSFFERFFEKILGAI